MIGFTPPLDGAPKLTVSPAAIGFRGRGRGEDRARSRRRRELGDTDGPAADSNGDSGGAANRWQQQTSHSAPTLVRSAPTGEMLT